MPALVGTAGKSYEYSDTEVAVTAPAITSGQSRLAYANIKDAANPKSVSLSDANFGSPALTIVGNDNRLIVWYDNAGASRSSGTVTLTVTGGDGLATELALVIEGWDAHVRAVQAGGPWAYGDQSPGNPITAPAITSPAASSTRIGVIAASNFGRYHHKPAAMTAGTMQADQESFTSIATAYESVGAGPVAATDSWTAYLPYDAGDLTAPASVVNGAGYIAASIIVGPAGSTITVTGGGEVDISGSSTPPAITSASPLPSGTVGAAYTFQLQGTGTGPFTWSAVSGNWPPGLSMSSAGLVSGTPTQAITADVLVQLAGGASPAATKLLRIVVGAATSAPSTPINPVAVATSATSIQFTATDTSNNETGFEIRRKTASGGVAAETASKGPNTPTHLFTGLAANTQYWFDIRATGATSSPYTSEVTVTTPPSTTLYAEILTRSEDDFGVALAGSTGWIVSVWTAPGVGQVVGTLLGQYTGQVFEGSLVSGEARMRVNLGSAAGLVTDGQSLRVVLTDGTRTTGVISATVAD